MVCMRVRRGVAERSTGMCQLTHKICGVITEPASVIQSLVVKKVFILNEYASTENRSISQPQYEESRELGPQPKKKKSKGIHISNIINSMNISLFSYYTARD